MSSGHNLSVAHNKSKNILQIMKIQKLQEFTEMRRQRRFSEHPFVNESLTVNYETLLKVDSDLTTKAAIVFPTNVEYTKETINVIKDTIDTFVIEHLLTEEVNDYQIGCLLCGEYSSQDITFDEKSICVLFSGCLSDSKHLTEISMQIMAALEINHALIFAADRKVVVDRFDDGERQPRIKRLEDF